MPRKRAPLTDEEGEVRELTREDFKGMKPVREVMPELVEAMQEFKRRIGRPKSEAPKVHIGFRLAADVVEGIRATGKGYNARVEDALREAFLSERAPKAGAVAREPVAKAGGEALHRGPRHAAAGRAAPKRAGDKRKG